MNWKICLSDVDLGGEELAAVADVLRSKWLSMGEVTRRFEAECAEFLGVRHAFLVANGTAALHLAHRAVNVSHGDEVIVPSLTFVATANAAVYCGAAPVFADIVGADNLNISPDDIRAKITRRTKAITVVHYGGYPADMEAISSVAREHGLAVIEDAAHAPGARCNGAMAGTLGDIGCFSFFSNKNLVTGEGGAIVTNNDDYAERIRLMRSHGMTTLSYERHQGHAYSYDVVQQGYNYRANEITAALASVQLAKLRRNNARRETLVRLYRARLAHAVDIELPFALHNGTSSYHLMPILLSPGIDRRGVMDALRREGIQSSIHYPPIHRFQWYRQRFVRQSVPVTEDVASRELTLPLHPLMTEDDVATVCQALLRSLAAATSSVRAG